MSSEQVVGGSNPSGCINLLIQSTIKSLDTTLPDYGENISLQDLIEVIIQRTSVGGLMGESIYTSASSGTRYNNIAELINSNLIPGISKETLSGKIRIRECACGKGKAIEGLLDKIHPELQVDLDLFDILDPNTIIDSTRFNNLSKNVKLRSINSHSVTEPYELESDISIMGYVLPYITIEDLQLAIENVLKNCKLLAIIPGDATAQSQGKLSTLYIWKGKNGYNYRYTYSAL